MALLFLYLSWPIFVRTYTTGEISTNAGGLLLWPARLMVPLGFALLSLQGISELIKSIYAARTGIELEQKEKVEV